MSETTPSVEKLEKQLRVLQRKLERSEWHRSDLENQHDRDQHLYRRLQADLEAARREAEVEAALERVRTRTMAMRESTELGAVIQVVFREAIGLDFGPLACDLVILDPQASESTFWISGQGLAEDEVVHFRMSRLGHPHDAATWAAWENEEVLRHAILEGDACSEYMRQLTKAAGDAVPDEIGAFLSTLWRVVHTEAFTRHGYLRVASLEPLSDEATDILQRFARVFDQAYTRYLDLEEAEKRAREAEIEAALERLRSQTMAMRSSDELGEISFELVKQVQALGVDTWHCAFNVYDEGEESSTEWGANADGYYPTYHTPRVGVFRRYYEIGQSGADLHVEVIGEDRAAAHYEQLCALPGVGDVLLERRASGVPFPESQVDHVAFFKYGYLIFITYEPTPDAHDVFRRFAKVFEQTYTRFLDLRQAEANAREAQIEAAMERVRSRALAMTSPEELLDVIFKIRKEFSGLGLECGAFWHTRYTPEAYHKALTSIDGQKLAAIMELPRDFASNPALSAWERGDETVGVFPFDAEAGSQYLDHMVTKGHFDEVDPEAITEEMVRENGGLTFVQARTSHGEIGYSLWGEAEPTEEAKDVLVRFATTFDLAYRRFLDLQKAEADHQALLEEKALTERALDELRATQDQLVQKEKMASLGALTAGIAHEIKNPLNFVNNFASLSQDLVAELAEEADPDERSALLAVLRSNAEKIEEHGRRADAIVRAMMDHARSGSGERREVAVNALIEEHAAHALHAARIRYPDFVPALGLDLADAAGTVEVVPQEIGRVVINLIDNALDATRQHAEAGSVATVTVSTRRTADGVEIRVADNGPGIEPEVCKRVFEPFYTTKPTGQGNTGLGLSLAHDIVTQGHGGTLTVESGPGEGAVFSLVLPTAPGEDEREGPERLSR